MKDIRIEKMICIDIIMNKYNYNKNETIMRRIENYDFQLNTIISHDDKHIKISTETNIKGVYNILFLFPSGASKSGFEFS